MTRPINPLASSLLLALVSLTACGGGANTTVVTTQGIS